MSDALKKLHDYLAKSPSVVYPEDVLAYLPAIEAENARLLDDNTRLQELVNDDELHMRKVLDENARLRQQLASFIELSQDMVIYAGQNMKRHFAKRLRKLGVPL